MCILSVVCGFFGRGGSVMGWLVSRSVLSISWLVGFLDRDGVCLFLGWSGASWFFPDGCQVVCLVFLCV